MEEPGTEAAGGPAEALREQRRRAAERLARLRGDYAGIVEASRDTNADDEHDPEGHTIAYERSQVGRLVRQAEERLADIDAALDRLATGGFGRCERCGGVIPAGRLEVRPAARTCVACA